MSAEEPRQELTLCSYRKAIRATFAAVMIALLTACGSTATLSDGEYRLAAAEGRCPFNQTLVCEVIPGRYPGQEQIRTCGCEVTPDYVRASQLGVLNRQRAY